METKEYLERKLIITDLIEYHYQQILDAQEKLVLLDEQFNK